MSGKYLPLIKPGSNWNGSIRFIPRLGSLGLASVRIPTENGRQILQLERAPSQPDFFLGFRYTTKNPTQAQPLTAVDGSTVAFTERHIDTIKNTVLWAIPRFSPQDTTAFSEQKLAELKTQALGWHTKDSVTFPLSSAKQLTVEKTVMQSVRPPDVCVERSAAEYLTLITRVVRESVLPGGQRNQVVITFHGNDYFMYEPSIAGRILTPDPKNPSGYTISDSYEPARTPSEKLELMRSLISVLVKDLSG